jgi:tetratricopeptide (TPR) repeat protein
LSPSNPAAGQFEPALQLLKTALQKSPDDPRALYYEGVILRHQGKIAEAAARQKQVLIAFPKSRHARQELGYDYYLQAQYESARSEFEALKDINPDDLTAHYYLSLIYPKLGMLEEGRKEGTAYAEHREDPTVASTAQDFWRANPFLVNELSPYHVHENVVRPPKNVNVGGYLQ